MATFTFRIPDSMAGHLSSAEMRFGVYVQPMLEAQR